MGDSDSDGDAGAPRKRQKRFTFKTFAQRVAEVGHLALHSSSDIMNLAQQMVYVALTCCLQQPWPLSTHLDLLPSRRAAPAAP